MDEKPILCLDFDGVCHSYTSGWQGVDDIPDPPVPGLGDFLREAQKHFRVYIHSSRSSNAGGVRAMGEWFERWVGWDIAGQLYFPTTKPPALITIDDRAITFTGTWPDIEELKEFKPWNKR